jgi:hypothetical protein
LKHWFVSAKIRIKIKLHKFDRNGFKSHHANQKGYIMTFKNAAIDYLNETPARTANGMKARKTSASAVLDFFGKAGSSRGTNLSKEFTAALADNEDLAVRALLWTRDIRSGAGERKQFRDLLVALESANPDLAGKLMHKVPLLGRWDDLFAYTDPINRRKALEMYADALRDGVKAKKTLEKLDNMTEEQCQKLLDELQ